MSSQIQAVPPTGYEGLRSDLSENDAHHYGKTVSLDYLRRAFLLERDGVSMAGLAYGAEKIGLRTYAGPRSPTRNW